MSRLEQVENFGKQKEILFTRTGEQLLADARKLLAEIETSLAGGERVTGKSQAPLPS